MGQWPTLEEQIEAAGIYYPRSYDITYRIGYVLQSIGAVSFAIMYGLKSSLWIMPMAVFEAGIILCSLYLLVWKAEIKRFIKKMAFAGAATQVLSFFIYQNNAFYGHLLFFIGLGFVLIGGAGLVGKEAYCFRFNEGWLLLIVYPLAVIHNLFGVVSFQYNVVIASVIAVLQVSFLRRKLSQPLLKKCENNVCNFTEMKK